MGKVNNNWFYRTINVFATQRNLSIILALFYYSQIKKNSVQRTRNSVFGIIWDSVRVIFRKIPRN
jgi:hypothetical protein